MKSFFTVFRLTAALFMIIQSAGPMIQGELIPFARHLIGDPAARTRYQATATEAPTPPETETPTSTATLTHTPFASPMPTDTPEYTVTLTLTDTATNAFPISMRQTAQFPHPGRSRAVVPSIACESPQLFWEDYIKFALLFQ